MMKTRRCHFILGFILGVVLFGGSVAFAAGIMAQPKTALVLIDGKVVDLKGYIIDDSHYFQLRDLSAALKPGGKDFSITWDETNNRVLIDTGRGYAPTEEHPLAGEHVTATNTQTPTNNAQSVIADGSGSISSAKITEKVIDGRELSREDFSLQANQSIFGGIYTRGLYNAIRQTVVDRDKILSGDAVNGFNPYYSYANLIDKDYVPGENEAGTTLAITQFTLPGYMSAYYNYYMGVEPYVKDYYKHIGYGIVKVELNEYLAPANTATDSLIREVSALTDREKVVRLANIICDRMAYGKSEGGPNEIFTSPVPVKGLCGSYSNAFLYLCQRAGIPCLTCADSDHAWNVVFTDGCWSIVDVTNYSVARDMVWLLTDAFPKTDENPALTKFLQEVLVPGSTK